MSRPRSLRASALLVGAVLALGPGCSGLSGPGAGASAAPSPGPSAAPSGPVAPASAPQPTVPLDTDVPSSRRAYDAFVADDVVPFDLPSTAVLRASPKKVFANWVTALPLSLDNLAPDRDYYATEYLEPTGEGGKHAAYGGYLRDRPLGRAPLPGHWRLADLRTEVRQAVSAGIDGFTMVIYQLPGDPESRAVAQWNTARMMMRAAASVDPGFKIIPMPDMSALTSVTPDQLARAMSYLARFPSIYRTADGRALYSPFYAERQDVAWWSNWLDTMARTYGTRTALWPTFLNETANQEAFAPIVEGIAGWGARDALGNPTDWSPMSPKDRIRRTHELGEPFMTPVSVQDARPRSANWVEARNLETLRNTWDIALDGDADWVQLLTWNDLPESSGILPSLHHGWSLMDLMAYYTTWFKTGTAPTINQDAVYLTHRKHFAEDRPTFAQSTFAVNIGQTPTRDAAEAQLFLTAPATVTVRSGSSTTSCDAPAGVSTCLVPLGVGTVSAEVVRDGALASRITSPWAVTRTPYVQDLQYVGVSSLREGRTPVRSRTVSLAPAADAYVAQAAPRRNFGRSSQLVARGRPGSTALLRFRLPQAPAGTTLQSVRLVVRTSSAPSAGSAAAAAVRLAGHRWTERGVTWRTRPAASGAVVGRIPPRTAPGRRYVAPLSGRAVSRSLGGPLGLTITTPGRDDLRLWAAGPGRPGVQPRLVLTFA